MSWGDDGPQRSQDELLAVVRAKADRIRWRRRLGVLAATIGVTAVLLGAVAVARPGGGGATRLQTLDPGSGATATGVTAQTTVSAPVTTAPQAAPTVATAVPIPTTVRSTPTTSPRHAAPTVPPTTGATTTTTLALPPVCTASDLLVTAASDRTSYAPGQLVTITLSIKNRGPSTCWLDRDPGMTIRDAQGKMVFGEGIADMFTFYTTPGPPPGVVVPGEVRTVPLTWDHAACGAAGTPCLAGTYSADIGLGELGAAPLPVALT